MLTFNNNDFATLDGHKYTLRDVIEALGYDWGMQDYPIFDEGYREKLNRAIYNHFCFRRIASETPAMFIFFLNRRMNEQMPNINPVYELVRREQFDPFATTQGKSNSATQGKNSNQSVATASSTPQVFLDNPDGEQYLTGVTKQTDSGNQDGKAATTYSSISGVGNAVYDMMASSFMATDNLVFNVLEPLFMQTWDDMPIKQGGMRMQSKEDYKHMRVQLESMRLCFELDAKHAMMDNDIDAYYALNPLTQEISTCIRRVDALIKLIDERSKIEPKGDGGNGGV